MDTLYYRKIAEIILRDESDTALRSVAARVSATPYDNAAKIAKSDRRKLKVWMRHWCDQQDARAKGAHHTADA